MVPSNWHTAPRLLPCLYTIVRRTRKHTCRHWSMDKPSRQSARYPPGQWKMKHPLSIQGVGDGAQTCTWETKLPIAVLSGNNEAEVHYFETPIVEGGGEDLPALLGLRSIRAKNGVIETQPGQERLSFPGQGGYTIQFSPGTKHIKLECAPSGHLVIPCCEWTKVQSKAGVPIPRTTFHATPTQQDHSASSNEPAPTDSQDRILAVRSPQ